MPAVLVLVALLAISTRPVLAETTGHAEPARAQDDRDDRFDFGIALGIAHCFGNYIGGHIGFDLNFKIRGRSHIAVLPAYSGGIDIERDLGVHNWTGTIAYRYLVPMSNKRASVLLGPTAGYWINNDNGSWITIGGTLQSELLWTGSVDYGLFVGLVLVHNETLNDDVPSEFDAGIHFGGKIVF
jgi:hypothetical protein